MARMVFKCFCACILIVTLHTDSRVRSVTDLYDILGVSKMASTLDIKRAYKRLAREWHPDKNKDPSATDRFTKINEAYETLGDPEKRSQYDKFGYTTAQEPLPRKGSGFDDFPSFFTKGPFGSFNFNFGGESVFDKYVITSRFYETKILPESYRKPYFIYAHDDFCFNCFHFEPLIEKLIKELNEVGIGVGTIHVTADKGLASDLRIHDVPTILAVINGKRVYYRNAVTMQNLREFIRGLFPSATIQQVSDKNSAEFLSGWGDNRVRALFFISRDKPAARFLVPAFYFCEKIASGFVNTKSNNVKNIIKMFNINEHKDTLVIINEDTNSSIATVTMQVLPRRTVEEVMGANQYLMLPRLSSQTFFDDLCPPEVKAKRRKLCVILVSKKSAEHNHHRSTFRDYTQQVPSFNDRVKFVYLFEETQQKFVKALTKGNNTQIDKNTLKVAILWRMEQFHLNYEWMEPGWSSDDQLNSLMKRNLEKRLHELLTTDHHMLHRTLLPDFTNEHALSLIVRIFNKFLDWFDRIYAFLIGYDSLTLMSVWFAVCSVILISLLMKKLMNTEFEKVKKMNKQNLRPPSRSPDNTIRLYELCFDSYNKLVKEADTGLTITILVDRESRDILLQQFTEIILPYSRYNAFTFAFLQLEHYLGWYRHLLEESIDFKVHLSNINIRNCIGTVLAINGYRKYYYIYHAKSARKWMRHTNINHGASYFETDESDSDNEPKHILMGELLDGLANWMDKIFDGMVRKIRVPYWPQISS